MKKGKLYLIPIPLGQEVNFSIAEYVIHRMHEIDIFIAEKARTARRYIKSTGPARPISDLTFFELNKHTLPEEKNNYLKPCLEGKDIGLMSEAGCPGIADPGAEIVAMAHKMEIEVVPFVGPSSIFLALMASGMNGQKFTFHGYLSSKQNELAKDLKRLEQSARKFNQSQICIETPYRNNAFIETSLKTLSPNTRLCIACDLTLPNQYILTKRIAEWKKTKLPNLHKRPAVFILMA